MSQINFNRPVLQSASWFRLSLLTGLVWTFLLFIYKLLLVLFGNNLFIPVVVFCVGLVYIIFGGILVFRSNYEFFPEKKYIMGATITGIIYAIILFILLKLFLNYNASLSTIAYIITIGGSVSVLLRKYALSKKMYGIQFLGIFAVIISSWIMFNDNVFFMNTYSYVISILVLLSIFSLMYKKFNLDVVSPWVLSVWKGVALVIVSVFYVLYEIFFQTLSISEILNIPVYHILLFILAGIFELFLILFKHKTRMSGGYIAYKQFVILFTFLVFAALIDIVYGVKFDVKYFVAVLFMLFGFLLIERRLFGVLKAVS